MSAETLDVFAGDCSVQFDDNGEITKERGAVVVLAKPDGTILVHDREGYRPVAWLTRADQLTVNRDENGPKLEAVTDDRRLSVVCHAEYGSGRFTTSLAGSPVGTCPDCDGALVHANGAVTCLGCSTRYGVPADARITDDRCGSCDLPRMQVSRGAAFDLCIDRDCESMDEAVTARFDRAWSCPACDGDLRILRRGGLIAGCEEYPDCETGFAIPTGVVDGRCTTCALPMFETASSRRCLDATCPG